MAAALLAVACGIAFWNSFHAGLILDNTPLVLQDERLRTVAWPAVRDIFGHDYWWPTGDSGLYRPLTTLSLWFNYAVLGNAGNPAGYHVVNLLLHWLNAVLAFVLVRRVTRRAWLGLAAAAVLATHPLTVESVTNVIGRADLMAALSTLGGLLFYLKFLDATGTRRHLWLAGLAAACLGGLFSKESAVVLPLAMLLHDLLFGMPGAEEAGRFARFLGWASRRWQAYAVVAAGFVVFAAARWVLLRDIVSVAPFGGDNPIVNAPLATGVMTAVKVIGYELSLAAWPARLSCDYSFDAVTLFGWTATAGQDPHAWLALAAILALAAAVAFCWRRQPAVSFFLGFAAIAFLPTSNLLFPIGTIMAERFMYLPLVGLTAAVAIGVALVGDRMAVGAGGTRRWTVAGVALSAAVVIALAARTVDRNEDWASSVRLWSSAAAVVPDSYKVHKALALEAMQADPSGGRVEEAIALADRSIGIIGRASLPLEQQPAGLFAEAGSYRLREAQLLSAQGQPGASKADIAKAIELLQRAETIDREMNRLSREKRLASGLLPAAIHDAGSAFIYRTLATVYLGGEEPLRAAAAAGYLQRISPGHFDAHYLRGVTEAAAAQFEDGRGNGPAAEEHLNNAAVSLTAATLLNPVHRESWSLLAKVYGYLSPGAPAVVITEAGGSLDRANPSVVRHTREACSQLLAQMRGAGLDSEAAALRARLITDLSIPAEWLDSKEP